MYTCRMARIAALVGRLAAVPGLVYVDDVGYDCIEHPFCALNRACILCGLTFQSNPLFLERSIGGILHSC